MSIWTSYSKWTFVSFRDPVFIRGMELACILVLAYKLELACKLELLYKLEHELEQPCGQGQEHRKRFLRKQPQLRFQNRHRQCYRLQFVYDHRATKRDIDRLLSTHHDAHFVQNLHHCSHLERHIHNYKQRVHLHKLELCHKLVLEHGMQLLVQLHRLRQGGQKRQRRTTM